MKEILKNFVVDYNKKFVFYYVRCKWKLHFSDITIDFDSKRTCNCESWKFLKMLLISKIKYFENKRHKFSHISEMNFVFISNLRDLTYNHDIKVPKTMLEWAINIKLAKNPELINSFDRSKYHPLIRKYSHIPFNN